MKLQTKNNTYVSSNNELEISPSMKIVSGKSYDWWCYVQSDSVGNIVFNRSSYSSSTSKHQRDSDTILDRLGIKISLTVRNTKETGSISKMINGEIKGLESHNLYLKEAIEKKGSWKKTNTERKLDIKENEYRIKDLKNYRDNYIDKKLIPIKPRKTGNHDLYENSYKPYFLKPNGKLQSNEYREFIIKNRRTGYTEAPANIDKLKELLTLNQKEIQSILGYDFIADVNNMIPNIDTIEYTQLKRWLKSNNIDRSIINNFACDKMHSYLTNKQNRREYTPSEAREFPINSRLLELDSKVKELILIKTDRQLREEGRKQSHCIGGKDYINSCLSGNHALNYKGFTFYLDSELNLIQTNGSHNRQTPYDIQIELMDLIAA